MCVKTVLDSEGRIDVLVNNAGTTHLSLAEETDVDEARAVFETNFFGIVRMTNAVLPAMRARKSGRIINIGSVAGLVAIPGQAFYTASKFALEGYTEALCYEVEPFGVHVSLIEPGFYRTRLQEA
jgi:short-subunit dehydrogenase